MESSSFKVGLSKGWMDCMLASKHNINGIKSWIKKTNMEMERFRRIVESNAKGVHSAEIGFGNSASCTSPSLAYLTVIPANQVGGQLSLVQVLHIFCDVPPLMPPHTVTCGIMGNSKPPVLPLIKQAPMNGLEPYFDKFRVVWPWRKGIKSFYKTHCAAKLLEQDNADVDVANPKLIFVPTTWIGAFLEPIPPSVAYERALCLKKLLRGDSIHLKQIQSIVHWAKVACVRDRGRGNPNGQMMIPWRETPEDEYLSQCVYDQVADMYPCDFPKRTPSKPRKALNERIKLKLQLLQLRAISFFRQTLPF
jgi:hypothetical protein